MHVVLFQPEIPPNTGNIARLCAAMRTPLHLIEPLGFSLDDKYLRRAGLDYWPHVELHVWPDLYAYLDADGARRRLVMTSARRGMPVHQYQFQPEDTLLFGPESSGLPFEVLCTSTQHVRIPLTGEVRSLNLSTAVGIILFQARVSCGIAGESLS